MKNKIKILDLGCGKQRKIKRLNAEIIGLDVAKHPNVDVVHDLNKLPLPFEDEEFDEIHASHVLEHLKFDIFSPLMDEIYRILKPNGIFFVKVPHWKGKYAFDSPEHTRCFTPYTFNYFDKSTPKPLTPKVTNCNFKINRRGINFIKTGTKLDILNIFNFIYNIHPFLTEKILCNLIPPDEIEFELKVIK